MMTREHEASNDVRRSELAAFLRSRRERVVPEQVGLPRGRRRRTPGLRREEVAQLSSVGVTWYTWLEQARDIHVSAQVLDAIARALLLDPNERTHLFTLAGVGDPAPGTECASVSDPVRAVLRQLEPIPACVQNSRYDLLAYNRTYGNLLCDLDALAPTERNCMWLAFTHPGWARALVDREEVIRAMAAKFRSAMAGHIGEPAWKHMLGRLQEASPEFREIWERHEVMRTQPDRTKRFLNTHVGLLRLDYQIMWLGPQQGPRVIAYVPADAESRARLEHLQELTVSGPLAAA
ncbi:helix-turn-helix transcriptional regulator [Streptomyces sp. NPDC057702]|uniref:helix-turn-helix transcriptional regulator n=1 Tax=unclassified Streptomyces TaxID=2593676 RepID=UPI00369A14C7